MRTPSSHHQLAALCPRLASRRASLRIVVAILLLTYLINLGCASVKTIDLAEIHPKETILGAVYKTGEQVEFQHTAEKPDSTVNLKRHHRSDVIWRYASIDSASLALRGTAKSGEKVAIPLSELQSVQVERTNKTKVILLMACVGGAITALIIHNNHTSPAEKPEEPIVFP